MKPHDATSPDFIKSGYGFDPIYKAGFTGKGQHIAIATYDGFYQEDIPIYFSLSDINPAPAVDVVEFNGHPDINDDSAGETELDTEFSGTIAPGAQIHIFTSAHNSDAGEVQLFTAILDDNRAKVVNYSWGDCEPNETAQHAEDMSAIFARAVAQGVNVMVASGDSGAEGCPDTSMFSMKKYNATFPASIPYVVAVGGTSITGGGDNSIAESAWNGSSGGVSEIFALPSWQSGFSAPFSMRSIPDVAFNADPNTGQNAYVHDDPGNVGWAQYGGTSIAAPQWAGFLTLVGEARAQGASVGYINPLIYGMSDAERAQTFRDIVKGNNDGYKAAAGWDAATGWGSLRAFDLFNFLKSN
jgi:subtilase family serine protease